MKTINHTAEASLCLEDVLRRFSYDPISGDVRFRTKPSCKRLMVGDLAGTINQKGYRKIQIDGRLYPAHRLAWFMHFGAWPTDLLDHRNGVRSDNRIDNLRSCTNGQNKIAGQINKNNTSGTKGVGLRTFASGNQKWAARLGRTFLGYFPTYEEAVAARQQAESGVW